MIEANHLIPTSIHPSDPRLVETQGDSGICHVCAHHCRLAPGQIGACGVRQNVEGLLGLTTYGRVVAAALDPIEKKPLRHFQPGSRVYTIATPGCTLACRFCQNWEIALQPRKLNLSAIAYRSPEAVVSDALSLGAQGVGFSYTEPSVSLEYTLDVMASAHEAGLFNVWHTNGFLTVRSAEISAQQLDAACIDLKAAANCTYRQLCGGTLSAVLATARTFQAAGVWVEISTPLLTGQNDSDESISTMAHLIIDTLGPQTPWHLLRGHAAWKMMNLLMTETERLHHAECLARQAGLQHVYAYA